MSPAGCQHPCAAAGMPARNGSRREMTWGCQEVHGGSLLPTPPMPTSSLSGSTQRTTAGHFVLGSAVTGHPQLMSCQKDTLVPIEWYIWGHACTRMLIPSMKMRALIWRQANASLPEPQAPLPSLPAGGSPEPTNGQCGAERGPVSPVVA